MCVWVLCESDNFICCYSTKSRRKIYLVFFNLYIFMADLWKIFYNVPSLITWSDEKKRNSDFSYIRREIKEKTERKLWEETKSLFGAKEKHMKPNKGPLNVWCATVTMRKNDRTVNLFSIWKLVAGQAEMDAATHLFGKRIVSYLIVSLADPIQFVISVVYVCVCICFASYLISSVGERIKNIRTNVK